MQDDGLAEKAGSHARHMPGKKLGLAGTMQCLLLMGLLLHNIHRNRPCVET